MMTAVADVDRNIIDLSIKDRFFLNKEARLDLHDRTERFGFGILGASVYCRTYSRQMVDGSQERWADTVIRVVEGVLTMRKWYYVNHRLKWDEEYWQRKGERMADAIYMFRLPTAGRILWAIGSETMYRHGAQAASNCFGGEETFITKEYGLISFLDALDETVNVWTNDGWKGALVRSYGTQQTQRVTFAPSFKGTNGWRIQRSNIRRDITTTPNHRWELVDGSITDSLKEGDTVKMSTVSVDKESDDYKQGFVHGIVFGDGTRQSPIAFKVRLCGEKKQYVELFDEQRITYPKYAEGDPCVVATSHVDLKAVPIESSSADYVGGFIDGWIATDGSTTAANNSQISTQNNEAAKWLEEYAALGGYTVSGHSTHNKSTNYGDRSNPIHFITLVSDSSKYAWKVTSIEELDEAEVFCVENPSNERLTLGAGIYTLNCSFVEVRKLSRDAAWGMNVLMLGSGLGATTYDLEYGLSIPRDQKTIYQVPDTRQGWVESVQKLIESYENGTDSVEFDYSFVRAAGLPIKGFGGVASGPDPLRILHERLRGYLSDHAEGKTSKTRVVADVINSIGACVVAGNVRRSAQILLGKPDDDEFINLKDWERYPERSNIMHLSNNTAVLTADNEYETYQQIPQIAQRMVDRGEPGVLSLHNMQTYGRYGDKMPDAATGTNPCAEICLESYENCVISDVAPAKCVDEYGNFSPSLFYEALELATLITSTIVLVPTESDMTNAVIGRNRRIGVSLTGIADWWAVHPTSKIISWLNTGYNSVRSENTRLAMEAGVPSSIRVTTVKPSGTVSLLAGVSSGIHLPDFSRYIRRVRIGKSAAIAEVLMNAGVPYEDDVTAPNDTHVFTFMVDQGKVKGQKDVSLFEKASHVKILQKFFADNSVSVTLSYDPIKEGHMVEDVIAQTIPFTKTLSVLPILDEGAVYKQAPIEQTTLNNYKNWEKGITPIDWDNFGGSDGNALTDAYCSNDSCLV